MSTTLLEPDQPLSVGRGAPRNTPCCVQLTRFAGGKERGVCFQINDEDGRYVQLTKHQLETIIDAVIYCDGLWCIEDRE